MDNQKQQNSLAVSVYQPSETLVENWNLWISHEVIGQWQKSSPEHSELIILDIDDKQFYFEALSKLKSKIQSQKLSPNDLGSFKQAELRIRKFFDGIALSLKARLKARKSRCFVTFRESLSANLNSLSPKNVSLLISGHADWLKKRRDYFDTEKNNHARRQASAGIAFINLIQKLGASTSNSIEYKCTEESIWKALEIYFCSKLLVERYTVLYQTTIELLKSCESYLDSVNSSLEILDQIQKSLREKSSLHLLSIPVFTCLDKIDALEQKQKIESWVGQRVNQWGNSKFSWQEIEAQFLINTEPITLGIYQEFEKCFLEHGILLANQSKDHCVLHSTTENKNKNKIGESLKPREQENLV